MDLVERLTNNKSAKLTIHKVPSIIAALYVGNILQHRQIGNFSHIIVSPTAEKITSRIESGATATWLQLDIIKRNTKISENLSYYLRVLKKRDAVVLRHKT